MAAPTDELILLERVFLRLGSADTDEQLQTSVCRFLPPVLMKLASPQEGVRKKVMELLIHINKRIKSRPQVKLPVDTLLLQYQHPSASSFVINFTIIYIKIGYPRMEMKKQAELIPSVLNAVEGKPLSHQDSLMLMIMPALGHINVPVDPEKRAALLTFQDKPNIAKHFLSFLLDVLLLPYGSVGVLESQQKGQAIDWSQFTVPPGLSNYAFKRVMGENPPSAEQLEQTKLGLVKFLTSSVFPEPDILLHLIVAAADTRFSVANLADLELRKIVGSLDWSSTQLAAPLYSLFLGSDISKPQQDVKPEMQRTPANTRIRLKLLHYLCRVTKAACIIPPCIQVVFDSLYGNNTNAKLKSLALQFTSNIVRQANLAPFTHVAGVILNGMTKLVAEGEDVHKVMGYTVIGQLGQRIPSLINKDSKLLRDLFNTVVSADGELGRAVRDALVSMTSAFVLDNNDEINIALMIDLLSTHIESPQLNARFVAMHYAANVFPCDNIPSRYLLLLACGDSRHEISTEAMRALYGVVHKSENEKLDSNQISLPDFSPLVTYICTKMHARIPASSTGSKVLPYNVSIFSEIITYLRACLAKSATVPARREPLVHPCEYSPLVGRYLTTLHKEQPEVFNNYVDMILLLAHVSADHVTLQALVEVIGSVPHYIARLYEKEREWLSNLLKSTKADVRQLAARIYGTITGYASLTDFEKYVPEIINMTNAKNLESQHGALLALTYTMEKILIFRKNEETVQLVSWKLYIDIVNTLCKFLDDNSLLLMDTAIQGIGTLGKTCSLPLPNDGTEGWTKKKIVEILLSAAKNVKLNSKTKEKAIISLGFICIGESFPYTQYIVQKIIATAKETKDIDIHLAQGEALVHCVQGQTSPEARDTWTALSNEHHVTYSDESTALLIYVVDEMLSLYKDSHPNLRQAVCVWLLAIVKHNIGRDCIKEKFPELHQAFMDFLAEDSDIIQDMAAKGLGLIHINSKEEDRHSLVTSILDQFMQGRKTSQKVTPDTKLFEEGQLGKTPTSGNLSTYKEICSLATELQKPDLVYYFMHLANHNAIWSSKKGAGFGFAAIAKTAHEELNKYLPYIIPRLYRYQFDPTPKIQHSMSSIWHSIVPSTVKAIEQYHKEIMSDIIENLTNNEWRVRISCCNALSEVLKANVNLNLAECASEIWAKLFRVMDDIHEGTRVAATNASKILSKICVRHSSSSHGKDGERIIHAILPVLLDIGVVHPLATVRSVSLQTVSELVVAAGPLLKPSLVTLIPALLNTIGESENPKLSYLNNIYSSTQETQEMIESVRASVAKGHYASETITKCVQYIDADTLKELMPKVIELIKCSIGFGTKIACSQFLIILSVHAKEELKPHAGKVLSALMNGLTDRNTTVRKHTAQAIGHIVASAKGSNLDKLFNTLNSWYMEREDDSSRLAIGQTLQSINNYHQDILKNYSDIVLPLTFFAMHVKKVPENEATVELWTDLWNDISLGTENGIKQHLDKITNILQVSLESASWTTKVQAANAVHTIAQKLGSNIDVTARDTLLKVLTDGLRGRTWEGKERLLQALTTLTCSSKEALKSDNQLTSLIVQTLYRESKRESLEYRRHALQALATVLQELDIDKFTEVYDIAQETLTKMLNNEDEDELVTEGTKRKENIIKLQETIYDTLGKAWPSSKETQDKYSVELVTYCHKVFPNSTRAVQVSILATLNLFVDKLALFKISKQDLSPKDNERLDGICDMLYKILKYAVAISKYTRIRKEALNIILSLAKKLRDTQNTYQVEQLRNIFQEFLPELTKDNQPEIRTRVTDIKEIFNTT